MPRPSRWVAKHEECQVAVTNVAEKYRTMLQKRIRFICSDCGEDFTETLEAFASQPFDEIEAPALCIGCGHGAEDEG